MIPQQPPNRDPTIGPAFYNPPPAVEVDASKLYHGVHFGKYSGKRTDFAGKAGPGPGEYDLNDAIKLEIHHINMKTWDKRPELQVARYPDNILKTAAKEVRRRGSDVVENKDVALSLEYSGSGSIFDQTRTGS